MILNRVCLALGGLVCIFWDVSPYWQWNNILGVGLILWGCCLQESRKL